MVANPPFSDKSWSTGLDPANDAYERFKPFGVPPAKQGDDAYLLHIVRSLKSTGKGACILPHGVLFRGNAEADIRRALVRKGFELVASGLVTAAGALDRLTALGFRTRRGRPVSPQTWGQVLRQPLFKGRVVVSRWGIDVDGDFETGFGLGVRFGDPAGGGFLDLLGWSYRRQLQETVALEGTFYGGDLDLLNGPFDAFSLPIEGDDKEEIGANLRAGVAGLSLFGQYVAQELAGMDRTGWEVEAAWTFELPLVWASGGRQLFPTIQPAVRYSYLEPEFAGGSPA